MQLSQNVQRPSLLAIAVLSLLAITVSSTQHARTWFGKTGPASASIDTLPPLILWAWERPEDLRQIDTERVAVAFLARTIYLRGDETVVKPRFQPLRIPSDARLMSVARIESDRKLSPLLSDSQLDETATAIVEMASQPRILGVQIDFDATVSERDFYRKLLHTVRASLPAATTLSITALASWCAGDNWIDSLPIDEGVPMLFRMGADENQFRARVMAGKPFRARKCQDSIGVSTDEALMSKLPVRRTYVFNPKSWSSTAITHLLNNQ